MADLEHERWNDDLGTIEGVAVEVLGGDLVDGFPAVVITTPDGAVIDLRLDRDEAHQLVRYVGEAIEASEKGEEEGFAHAAQVTLTSADGRR